MKKAFVNANVLTGKLDENGNMIQKKGTVIVEDGKFLSVCDQSNYFGCEIIDLQGKYMVPGLINMHVHIAASGGPEKKRKKPVNYKKLFETLNKYPLVMNIYKKIQKKNVENLLFSGVTTVRTVGGILDFDGQIRDAVKEGKTIGPRMLVCNTAISVPGGHFAGSLATEATSPEMAAEHVQNVASTNPDWIKIMITGGVMDAEKEGEPGTLRMPLEIAKSACDEAHKLGYKVCAHVESTEGVAVALNAGVDSIEHGANLDEKLLKQFKKQGTVDVCTVSPAVPLAKAESIGTAFTKVNAEVVLDGIINCAKSCIENDIPVGLGTDSGCPYTTSYNTWRELVLWVKMLGVTPDFALYSATFGNAKLLNIDQITGSIENGKSADFVIVENNPLDDLFQFRDITMVSIMGQVYDHPKIKKNSKVEALWEQLQS